MRPRPTSKPAFPAAVRRERSGALGQTRTGTDCSTRPSNVRVYQFRHQGTVSRGNGILTKSHFVDGEAGAGNAGTAPGAEAGAGAGAGTAAFAGVAALALARTEDLGRAWIREIVTARTENATKDHVVILSRSV